MINSDLFKKIIILNDRWFNRDIQCSKNLQGDFYINCKNCFGELTNMRNINGYDNYNCEWLTYYYICSHLNSFSSQIFHALNSDFLKFELQNLNKFNILSLGCGAAPDFIAVNSFNKKHIDIEYEGIDISEGWKNNQDCISIYCKYNNYTQPQFYNMDVMDYVKQEKSNKFNVIILQSIISTFAKLGKKKDLEIFITDLFNNIVLNSSENVHMIISDVNHIELYRDEWMNIFEKIAHENNYKTKKKYFDGYNEDGWEKYLNNNIVFSYPDSFDPNDDYNKSYDCKKYIQLLIKKG